MPLLTAGKFASIDCYLDNESEHLYNGVRPKTFFFCGLKTYFALLIHFWGKMSVEQTSINSSSMLSTFLFWNPSAQLPEYLSWHIDSFKWKFSNINFIFMVYIYSSEGNQWYWLWYNVEMKWFCTRVCVCLRAINSHNSHQRRKHEQAIKQLSWIIWVNSVKKYSCLVLTSMKQVI